jgi:hypothetical protein
MALLLLIGLRPQVYPLSPITYYSIWEEKEKVPYAHELAPIYSTLPATKAHLTGTFHEAAYIEVHGTR